MVWDTLVMKTQSSMKILLVFALIAIYLVNNIQSIQIQNQHQPTSYSSSNIQTQYRQIDNYIKSNVVPQPQLVQNDQQINSYQSTGDSHYQIAPSSNNYYHDINNAQTKFQDTFNNQQPQSFYVNVDKPLPRVQEQPQGPTSDNHNFLLRQENENILANNVPTTQYTHQIEAPQQIQHYSEQIQQTPRNQIIQSGSDLIPAQQRTIPVEQYQQYTIQNQPESEPNHVVYQPQPDPYSLPQTQLQSQPQPQPQPQPQLQLQPQPQPQSQPEEIYQHQLPQNIPQQYNYEPIQEKPSQNANYPAYQQVLVNNEAPPKPKQSSGYKVRESPVERQTEEYSPTSDPFAGQQIVRNSQLFHDLAVHGSFNNDGNVFGQLQYPNQQISRGPTQQLSQNTYDVFSDSIQGQQHAGLSAYSSDGTPQQRLLNSGL